MITKKEFLITPQRFHASDHPNWISVWKEIQKICCFIPITPSHSKGISHVSKKPTPADLKAEIEKLYSFVKAVVDRRKNLGETRDAITKAALAPLIMSRVSAV